ncbi:MAG: hypothetical protein GC203_02000 [Phenylobacterium sp.]|uniref:hypothetical protein n=1 Tax=Phenylobacterium sp. TaxID=1871053 RepID=UPI0025ED6EC9|nr:hypothetical protein [Phenylobacterium sp.]MBI1196617.1 hypothetical protein [Phenylobacterium sp.]
MPRSARRIAAAFALTLAATPALAGGLPSQAAKQPDRTSAQTEKPAVRLAKIPEPHAPLRQPLQMRRSGAFEGGARLDSQIPAKDDWFDDQGLSLDANGLAYKIRF